MEGNRPGSAYKAQMSDYDTLPAAGSFDMPGLDDAYLIVSLENLV